MKKTLLSCVSLALALAPVAGKDAKAAPTKTVHRQSDRIVINWDNNKSKMKRPTRVVKEEVRVSTPVTVTTKKSSYKEESSVYGKAYGMLGYEAQVYEGSVEKMVDAAVAGDDKNANSYNHSLALTLGYNWYFRANDLVHPFVGIVGEGRLPIHNKIMGSIAGGDKVSYSEWAYLALKAGLKFNLCENFALQPYGLFGGNLATISEKDEGKTYNTRRFGMTMGAGLEAILNDHVMIGGEWRYSTLAKFGATKMKTHTFAAKLGFMF